MALLVLAGAAADSMEGWGEQRLVTVPASGSFNGKPFECSVKLRERAARHLLFDVSFPSPVKSDFEPNNRVPGELFVPLAMEGAGRFPAIACLHILNGNYELERMMCARLAQHGVVALFFKQPYYSERGGETGKARLASNADIFLQGLTQGLQDTRRALDLLQALPGVDSDRLGITGISMGAFLAASTCGMDQRIHKAALLLGGCNVRGILMEARETRKLRAFVEGLEPAARERLLQGLDRIDPLAAAPALAKLASSDRLRMTNAELDQVVPPASTRRLAEAIGFADRVVWLKGLDHYTAMAALPQIMESTVAFFGSDAPQAWQPPCSLA